MAREFVHTKTLPFWYPVVIFGAFAVIIAVLSVTILPTALTADDEPHNVGRFIAERAANNTMHLANLGPKVTGSPAARLAREYILQQIEHIKLVTHPAHRLQVQVQDGSGSFFIAGMTSVYRNISNIIVRLSPADQPEQPGGAEHALLLNSHYDTVPISDGAGDDTFMVAIMLEVLRVLASSYIRHQHDIVFLFNGAEETGLQGSTAFVQQHEWARNTRAFINLDSSGAGGKDMLFQVTPGAGWLLRAYARAVPHVRANVVVQELFESGAVPSDTDFRVFRDLGGMMGVDIATVGNPCVYHTRHDRPEIIESGSYQNVGDNVLELTRQLASAPELGGSGSDAPVLEDMVFFDFLGWFLVAYTVQNAVIVNVCVGVAVLVLVLLQLYSFAAKNETTYAVMLIELGLVCICQIVSIVIAAALLIASALLYDLFDRPLSWYSNLWLTAGLYGAPLLLGLLTGPAVYLFVYRRRLARSLHLHKEIESLMFIPRSQHVQLFMHAQAVMLTFAVFAMTAMGFRMTYLIVLGLMFYVISMLINYVARFHLNDTRWVYVHLVGQFVPLVFYANMIVMMIPSVASIGGRSGTATNPELMMALLLFVFGLMAVGLLVPVVCMVRRPMFWLGGVALLWLLTIGLMFTPLGFPYRAQTTEQRFWIFHTDRSFNSFNSSSAESTRSDHGYLLLGMDRNSLRLINNIVPGIQNATSTSELCDSNIYCGLPLYTSRMLHQAASSHWLPTDHSAHSHAAAIRTTLTLVSNEPLVGDTRRYTFDLTGPCQMNVYLSPAAENRLVNWSFAGGEKSVTSRWHDRPAYLVFLSNGDDSVDQHTVRFAVDIQNKARLGSGSSFDIAVAGHFVHERQLLSDEFRAFLATFPQWAHVTAWISSYDSWQY